MRGSPSSRVLLPADKNRAGHVGQRRGLAVAQTDVEMLTFTCRCSVQQSGHDGVACVETSSQIRNGDSNLHWRTVPRTREMHQTKLGLDHDVESGPVAVGPGLAVACDTGIDQSGVDLPDGLIVHVVFLERAGQVVLDEDVAVLGELVKDLDTLRVCEG